MENINDFQDVMLRFKKELNIKSETAIAEKLGMSRTNYYDRKQRNSVPYENIVKICKFENISTDLIFYGVKNLQKQENYKEKLNKSINKLSEKEAKYFHYLIESKIAEKELNN